MRRGDFADLLRELYAHQLDVLLCDTEPSIDLTNGVRIVELHRPQLVAIAAPAVHVGDDWGGTPVLQYSNGSPYRWEIQAFLDGHAATLKFGDVWESRERQKFWPPYGY